MESGSGKKENCADIKKCVQKTGLLSSLQLLIITLTFDVSNSEFYMNLMFLIGQGHRVSVIQPQFKCQVPLCYRFCEFLGQNGTTFECVHLLSVCFPSLYSSTVVKE